MKGSIIGDITGAPFEFSNKKDILIGKDIQMIVY
jgi:hypothetical protein